MTRKTQGKTHLLFNVDAGQTQGQAVPRFRAYLKTTELLESSYADIEVGLTWDNSVFGPASCISGGG